MKQMITPKQLSELSHEQKLQLHSLWNPLEGHHYVWYTSKKRISKETYMVRMLHDTWSDNEAKPKVFALPLMGIGQMIEMLDNERQSVVSVPIRQIVPNIDLIYSESLCDSLWEVCKSAL